MPIHLTPLADTLDICKKPHLNFINCLDAIRLSFNSA